MARPSGKDTYLSLLSSVLVWRRYLVQLKGFLRDELRDEQ